jgi:hypothetical protein
MHQSLITSDAVWTEILSVVTNHRKRTRSKVHGEVRNGSKNSLRGMLPSKIWALVTFVKLPQ